MDVTEVLAQELATYEGNKDRLLADSEHKFVLIHGDEVVGVFESEADALGQGYSAFGNKPFLVMQVLRDQSPLNFASNTIGI